MSGRHQLVYSYAGEADAGLEENVARLFPGARRTARQSGMQGLTEVTLELTEDPPADQLDRLRGLPRIVDAAVGSLGEGV